MGTHIERSRLAEILTAIGGIRAAILGDLCVDIYWHADMRLSELSRETPHFPLPVVRERFSLGAGGNVAANVAALLPQKVVAIGVKGRDWRAGVLSEELCRCAIDDAYVVEDPGRCTFAYCKPIRKGISDVAYEDPRLDFINYEPIGAMTEEKLLAAMETVKRDVDVLLVSDQFINGCISPRIREAVCALSDRGLLAVVDSRYCIGSYHSAFLKPNEMEGRKALGAEQADGLDDEACAQALAHKTNSRVLMTLGDKGSVYADGGGSRRFAPWDVKGPVDIVGAGDAFLSGFACALAAGASVEEAADFGGLCSAVTIAKIGITGTASPEELLRAHEALAREE